MALKKGLGKGLGALISSEIVESTTEVDRSKIMEIDINKIEPNKDQPRKYFEESALNDLAESIKQYGILQPLIVKQEAENYYSIIAGERRWRAARMAKLTNVPVIVKDYTAAEILQIALIENIQRKDLNPIEEAVCYRRLIDEFFFTQEDIGEKVGRSRSSIANALRLLTLDSRVQRFLMENKLSEGQARALLTINDGDLQFEIAEKIIDEQLSVRETAAYIKLILEECEKQKEEVKEETEKNSDTVTYKAIESDLKSILGTKVNIREKNDKGKIEIEYYSHDELDRLLMIFKKL